MAHQNTGPQGGGGLSGNWPLGSAMAAAAAAAAAASNSGFPILPVSSAHGTPLHPASHPPGSHQPLNALGQFAPTASLLNTFPSVIGSGQNNLVSASLWPSSIAINPHFNAIHHQLAQHMLATHLLQQPINSPSLLLPGLQNQILMPHRTHQHIKQHHASNIHHQPSNSLVSSNSSSQVSNAIPHSQNVQSPNDLSVSTSTKNMPSASLPSRDSQSDSQKPNSETDQSTSKIPIHKESESLATYQPNSNSDNQVTQSTEIIPEGERKSSHLSETIDKKEPSHRASDREKEDREGNLSRGRSVPDRERHDDRERLKSRDMDRERDRERDRDWMRDRDRERSHRYDEDHERERKRARDIEYDRDRDRRRARETEIDRERERERTRNYNIDLHDRERGREAPRDRHSLARLEADRYRERERRSDRSREREYERDRARDVRYNREHERYPERARERDRLDRDRELRRGEPDYRDYRDRERDRLLRERPHANYEHDRARGLERERERNHVPYHHEPRRIEHERERARPPYEIERSRVRDAHYHHRSRSPIERRYRDDRHRMEQDASPSERYAHRRSLEPPRLDHRSPLDSYGDSHAKNSSASKQRPITSRSVDRCMEIEQLLKTNSKWIRCSPADLYFSLQDGVSRASDRLISLQERFQNEIVSFAAKVREAKGPVQLPPRKIKRHPPKLHLHHHHHGHSSEECDSSDSDEDAQESSDEDTAFEELQRKKAHPWRLHEELWYNEAGEMNDGPVCRCSVKARRTGIRHGIYPGEEPLPRCDPDSNNANRLHHYRLQITPMTNYISKFPTIIPHDNHDFIFEGFSLLSHFPLENVPPCRMIRFNIAYTISLVKEDVPLNFTVKCLDMFTEYFFKEILELVDINWHAHGDEDGCPRFHLFPRFTRLLEDDGKEFLSANSVLQYFLQQYHPLVDDSKVDSYRNMADDDWADFAKQIKGMVVTYPGMKPASLRVDQIDKEADESELMAAAAAQRQVMENNIQNDIKKEPSTEDSSKESSDSPNTPMTMESGEIKEEGEVPEEANGAIVSDNSDGKTKSPDKKSGKDATKKPNLNTFDGYPVIVHFGIRPPQLSYAGNPKYQKAWRDYVKFRHLLANKPKVEPSDRRILAEKEQRLHEMRMKHDLKRDVTMVISARGFYRTGIMCDMVQYALLIPVVICHLRFQQSIQFLESRIGYTFSDKYLLQLALTHPSYRENFGTNPDHARNVLTNCGIRQPEYGDRRVHFMNTRKRGINMLINIMSRFGCNEETASNINHNERLEFLGDAVVEFLSSIHLYFMFPDLEEGGLATYRAAIVQNQHLALLAKNLELDRFMLYAHGSDLCHDLELRHAMANCFEALMGSLFLDGGIEVADRVFSMTLWSDDQLLSQIWVKYPPHVIQQQEPQGDRHYIETIPRLKELTKFEELIGVEFNHIRLLARALTHRSVGFNNLTLGSNQRMEFLGDTVLQLIASEYLYKHFPEHHEGHLSLLRSSLVNNKTQAIVCDDLGMTNYASYNYAKAEMKSKDRADLLEAFLGALYVDKGLEYCKVFCQVCFFPRLEHFILNQDWNDPKSKLQQCCLTLRNLDGGEPDIPVYKVIECLGPTNTRVYRVAVYFRSRRLAVGKGHSIQEAEMSAATNALARSKNLFPQLNHQKKVIAKSIKKTKPKNSSNASSSSSAGAGHPSRVPRALPPPTKQSKVKRSGNRNIDRSGRSTDNIPKVETVVTPQKDNEKPEEKGPEKMDSASTS